MTPAVSTVEKPEIRVPETEYFAPAIPVPEAPPYAIFVAEILGLALCFSVLAFSASYNIAHSYWRIFPAAIVAFVIAIAFMTQLPRAWQNIEKVDNGAQVKKLARICGGFFLLFVATGAIVGAAIGTSGSETGQLLADSNERSRLAAAISHARDSVEGSIPAQIAMYKEIEPAVQNYEEVLRRLQAELPVYDEKFPTQHSKTSRTISSVEVDLKRTELIKQEIGIARDIELFDTAAQKRSWQERMQPLLEAESDVRR